MMAQGLVEVVHWLARTFEARPHSATIAGSGVRVDVFARWRPFHPWVLDRSPKRDVV